MSRVGMAAFAAALVLAGCSSSTVVRPEVLQSWVGRSAAALEKEWGPATREVTDPGQHLLVYDQLGPGNSIEVSRPGATELHRTSETDYVQTQSRATIGPGGVYVRSYVFWVDARGTIERVEVREP